MDRKHHLARKRIGAFIPEYHLEAINSESYLPLLDRSDSRGPAVMYSIAVSPAKGLDRSPFNALGGLDLKPPQARFCNSGRFRCQPPELWSQSDVRGAITNNWRTAGYQWIGWKSASGSGAPLDQQPPAESRGRHKVNDVHTRHKY